MAKKFKLGLIGVGMGQAHLNAIAHHLDGIEVIAAADINAKRLKTVSEAFSIQMTFTDYHKMLEVEEIEAVLVVTPNHLHSLMAVDCMKAGKHVLVEKPPSVDVKGAKEMLKVSKKTGMKLMYAMCNRFRADSKEARKMVKQGDLGDVYYARTSWLRRYGFPMSDWFNTKSESGGGPLIDLGVHILDMTWWIMGTPKPISASGVTYNSFAQKFRKRGWDVEDFAASLIRFENGATIFVESSWAGFVDREEIRSMVLGTKGGIDIILNPKPSDVHFKYHSEKKGTRLDSTSSEIEHAMGKSALADQLTNFVDCIRKSKKDTASAEEGVEIMKMLTGIYESAKLGKEVVL